MGAATKSSSSNGLQRGLASRGSSVHDLGATQSLAGSIPSTSSPLSMSMGAPGKSVWRLPPVQASTQGQNAMAPQQQQGETIVRSFAANIPHPAKMATGGEDAHFFTDYAFGVADGVGGWTAHGIDAGEYARGLMNASKQCVNDGTTDPLAILWHAYRDCTSLGSSTCLIIVLDKNRSMIHSANVGDSGFRVIRNGSVIYRCKIGQHYFNCPFQLGSHSSDLPSDAMRHSMNVQVGDLIVSGSDGLFDNLFDADIVSVCNEYTDIKDIAQNICQMARQAAGNATRQGPFALEAIASGIQFQGGKFDDVTVIVSRIDAAAPPAAVQPAQAAVPQSTGEHVESKPPSRGTKGASGSGPAACKFLNREGAKEGGGAVGKLGTAKRESST